jgi:Holliday junction resolvasome RuvABC endonuclease subunit
MQARLLGVAGVVRRNTSADCIGVSIEQPFGRNAHSLQTLYSMMGAASLAAVEAGLRVSLVNLVKLKMHATGTGNAKKPEMQAAAKAR